MRIFSIFMYSVNEKLNVNQTLKDTYTITAVFMFAIINYFGEVCKKYRCIITCFFRKSTSCEIKLIIMCIYIMTRKTRRRLQTAHARSRLFSFRLSFPLALHRNPVRNIDTENTVTLGVHCFILKACCTETLPDTPEIHKRSKIQK